jgi:hypothetical protein
VHVREAPADLVRYPTTAAPEGDAQAADQPAEMAADRPIDEPAPAAAPAAAPAEAASTLIIERRGRPEGVALGLGELVRLTSGIAMLLRGPRPALRAVAGTGPLVLSFEDEEQRDRAAAELLDESGLGADTIVDDPKEG